MRSDFPTFLLLALLAAPAGAFESVELSADVTVAVGAEVLGPEEVGEDDLAGGVLFTGVGATLPLGVDTVGFHRLPGGEALFAVDRSARLVGGLVARPRDVVHAAPGGPSLALDGELLGVPDGARIDALSVLPGGDLLVSFDVTVSLKGEAFADEDVVRVDAAGAASPFFRAASAGIDPALDIDALHRLANGDVLVSFDGSGSAGDVSFADEDLLEIDPLKGSVRGLAYDGSAQHPAFGSADLDAAFVHELDTDGDGAPDGADNCTLVPNPDQADANAFEDDDASQAGVQHYGDACDPDLNEDGLVAADDFFGELRPCMGETVALAPECAESDFDGDGIVGPSDFFGWFRPALGASPGPGVTE